MLPVEKFQVVVWKGKMHRVWWVLGTEQMDLRAREVQSSCDSQHRLKGEEERARGKVQLGGRFPSEYPLKHPEQPEKINFLIHGALTILGKSLFSSGESLVLLQTYLPKP